MRVLPPGPHLPTTAEPPDAIDLGARLRDQLYTRVALSQARESLGALLPVVIHHGDFEAASRVCQAWLETWPAATLIDEARIQWMDDQSDQAIAVLMRATELQGLARGWDLLPSGMALMPDLAWIADQLGDTMPSVVVSRGEGDGSEAIAQMLGTTVGEVDFTLDDMPPAGVSWADRLWPAAPQALGDRLVRCCEVASLPGSPERLARGDASEVGWLLWDGPHPPRAVHPAAVALIESLEQPRSREELLQATGWRAEELDTALDSLAAAGAVRGTT